MKQKDKFTPRMRTFKGCNDDQWDKFQIVAQNKGNTRSGLIRNYIRKEVSKLSTGSVANERE